MLRKNNPVVNRSGFTLIELVVVLMIIAVIAGLIVPQVAMLGRQADMAASAKSQADLSNNIQLHFVQLKRFPQGMDSLLAGDGGTAPTAVHTPMQADGTTAATNDTNQFMGLPISGANGTSLFAQLTMGTLSGNENRSLTRTGIDWVYDHETDRTAWAAGTNANSSGMNQRTLLTSPSGGTNNYAVVNPTGLIAATYFPNGVPVGSQLVAFGIGQRSSLVPKTMNNAPVYPGAERYYGRYVAIFQTFDTGDRAVLVTVVDAYGRTTNYTIDQFNAAGPDGGRQG